LFLVLTNSGDKTSDYLCNRAYEEKIPFIRLDTDTVVKNFSGLYENGRIYCKIRQEYFALSSIQSIWFRRPKPIKIESPLYDEAEIKFISGEWSAFIEGILSHIGRGRWINYPLYNANASYKIEQLSRVKKIGLDYPPTLISTDPEKAKVFIQDNQGEVILKPLESGYLEREDQPDTTIYTSLLSVNDFDHLKDINFVQLYFSEKLIKILM